MALTESDITVRVRRLHPDAAIEVTGEDCQFELHVISDDFAGQSILQRQKPILALFRDELTGGELHALSIVAKTRAEDQDRNDRVQLSP